MEMAIPSGFDSPPYTGGNNQMIPPGQEVKYCIVCHKPIQVQIFRGMNVCSEICRKIKDGEVAKQ